jgi:hypothetical protein
MKNSLLLIFVCYFAMSSAQNVYEKDPTWNTYELPNNQYFVDGSNFVKSEFQSDGKLCCCAKFPDFEPCFIK